MFEWDIHARESTANRTYCWLKQQSRWTGKWMSVTTVNEYRRNMEKPGISVKVKLMTRWNVNGTVVIQDSVPVSHTWVKNNTGYWQRWNPRAVYNRDRSSSLWIIHFILFFSPHFKENTLRAKCNERISPWICSMLDGKASELPHFVIPPCQW